MNHLHSVRQFIQQANQVATQSGVQARIEPLVFDKGVEITWMERRRGDRVQVEQFLSQLTKQADESGMPLQLAIPGNERRNRTLFARFGFKLEVAGADLIMQRQPEVINLADYDALE